MVRTMPNAVSCGYFREEGAELKGSSVDGIGDSKVSVSVLGILTLTELGFLLFGAGPPSFRRFCWLFGVLRPWRIFVSLVPLAETEERLEMVLGCKNECFNVGGQPLGGKRGRVSFR